MTDDYDHYADLPEDGWRDETDAWLAAQVDSDDTLVDLGGGMIVPLSELMED